MYHTMWDTIYYGFRIDVYDMSVKSFWVGRNYISGYNTDDIISLWFYNKTS